MESIPKRSFQRRHARNLTPQGAQRLETMHKNRGAPEGLKWCSDCENYRPLEMFPKGGAYCKPHKSKRGKAAYAANKRKIRESTVQRRYGLSAEDYKALLHAQGGACAICRGELKGDRDTHVDHCHDTGLVRGILCSRCNTGLGQFEDAPERLRAAIDYLQQGNRYFPK
jgi:hypothetical protein